MNEFKIIKETINDLEYQETEGLLTDKGIAYLKELKKALQLQQTGVMQRYFHPFVGAGTLIKETEKSLVIKLDFNGKEYFAPKHEFTELL